MAEQPLQPPNPEWADAANSWAALGRKIVAIRPWQAGLALIVVVLLALLLWAAWPQPKWEKLRAFHPIIGMSKDHVRAQLGAPDNAGNERHTGRERPVDVWHYSASRGDNHFSLKLQFSNDKLIGW
jgi:hypothetical protein